LLTQKNKLLDEPFYDQWKYNWWKPAPRENSKKGPYILWDQLVESLVIAIQTQPNNDLRHSWKPLDDSPIEWKPFIINIAEIHL
jgi:hypothetical protein